MKKLFILAGHSLKQAGASANGERGIANYRDKKSYSRSIKITMT